MTPSHSFKGSSPLKKGSNIWHEMCLSPFKTHLIPQDAPITLSCTPSTSIGNLTTSYQPPLTFPHSTTSVPLSDPLRCIHYTLLHTELLQPSKHLHWPTLQLHLNFPLLSLAPQPLYLYLIPHNAPITLSCTPSSSSPLSTSISNCTTSFQPPHAFSHPTPLPLSDPPSYPHHTPLAMELLPLSGLHLLAALQHRPSAATLSCLMPPHTSTSI